MVKTLEKPQLEEFLGFAEPLPELIASVPDWETLQNIDISSFDAFYLGQAYCLRYSGNFLKNLRDLEAAVDHLKSHDKRAYLTTPAVPKPEDIGLLADILEKITTFDGIEVHETGVFRFMRSHYPHMPLHIGHFANIYRPAAAKLFKRLGAKRVIPSYELTMEEKRAFGDIKALELETAIHGKIPLGMAFACLFTLAEGIQVTDKCRQQCKARTVVELQGWRMRCGGTTMLTAEDVTMIEFLPELMRDKYRAFRLETTFDQPAKISQLGHVYRAAMEEIQGFETSAAFTGLSLRDDPSLKSRLKGFLQEIDGWAQDGVCNGWFMGRSGRSYTTREEAMKDEPDWPGGIAPSDRKPHDEMFLGGGSNDG